MMPTAHEKLRVERICIGFYARLHMMSGNEMEILDGDQKVFITWKRVGILSAFYVY